MIKYDGQTAYNYLKQQLQCKEKCMREEMCLKRLISDLSLQSLIKTM